MEENNMTNFKLIFPKMHSVFTYLMDLMQSHSKQEFALLENHIKSDPK